MMPGRKIAVLIGESAVTYNSERAARRAGMDLRVFTCEQEALAWLQGMHGPAAVAAGRPEPMEFSQDKRPCSIAESVGLA